MDDRTMLELAAKIMGLDSVMEMYGRSEDGSIFCDANDPPTEWNSLQDDGDALRLAVKLKLCLAQTLMAILLSALVITAGILPRHLEPTITQQPVEPSPEQQRRFNWRRKMESDV